VTPLATLGPVRRLAVGVVVGVLPLGAAACGAGFDAQTYRERTSADGINVNVGAMAVRNASLKPPSSGAGYKAGADAEVALMLVNQGAETDRLVQASSIEATTVDLLDQGRVVPSLDIPGLGTSGSRSGLVLRGLTSEVRPGEYVELTLRFARNGEVRLQVPVATPPSQGPREVSTNVREGGAK